MQTVESAAMWDPLGPGWCRRGGGTLWKLLLGGGPCHFCPLVTAAPGSSAKLRYGGTCRSPGMGTAHMRGRPSHGSAGAILNRRVRPQARDQPLSLQSTPTARGAFHTHSSLYSVTRYPYRHYSFSFSGLSTDMGRPAAQENQVIWCLTDMEVKAMASALHSLANPG